MREMVTSLCARVLEGEAITRDQAMRLYGAPLEPLCAAADRIRRHFCANRFDLCAIINAKSGACGEDCRFCAQSAHSAAGAARYGLLPDGEILKQALRYAAGRRACRAFPSSHRAGGCRTARWTRCAAR